MLVMERTDDVGVWSANETVYSAGTLPEYNYLVIDMEHNIKLYKSLRELAKELNVSPSGISKKLKLSNYCTIVPKKTTTVYYIHDIAS